MKCSAIAVSNSKYNQITQLHSKELERLKGIQGYKLLQCVGVVDFLSDSYIKVNFSIEPFSKLYES